MVVLGKNMHEITCPWGRASIAFGYTPSAGAGSSRLSPAPKGELNGLCSALKICAAKQRKGFFERSEKVRKMSVDFQGKLWYVVLLMKGGLTGGSEEIFDERKSF